MNGTNPVARYQLGVLFRMLWPVYAAVCGTVMLPAVYARTTGSGTFSASGMEVVTMAAFFLAGVVKFRAPFRFFSSFGVSRARFCRGVTAALGIASAAAAALDLLNAFIVSRFISYNTLYAGLLSSSPDAAGAAWSAVTPALAAGNCLWCLLADFALGMAGFAAAALYYRMGQTAKILVSVGVPSLFFLLIPLLDRNVTGGRIAAALSAAWSAWTEWGLNPLTDLLTRFALIAALAYAAFAILRHADVKK